MVCLTTQAPPGGNPFVLGREVAEDLISRGALDLLTTQTLA
jgi:hypothetical protein